MSISPDLRFHLQGIDAPDATWTKLEAVFGKHIIIQAHQIEKQLMTLSPNDFSCIEGYLSKFKTLRILCIDCKIYMKEDRCIYIILSKLGNAYSVFISTFMSLETLQGVLTKIPLLSLFVMLLLERKIILCNLE